MVDGHPSDSFPSVDAKLRYAPDFMDADFVSACERPVGEAFVRTLGSLKTQVLSELRKGAEWKFSYEKRLFTAEIQQVGEINSIGEDHYLLELREHVGEAAPLVYSVVISIDLLEASAEDARFMVGLGNSTNGLIVPLVKIIDRETTYAKARPNSLSEIFTTPNFHLFGEMLDSLTLSGSRKATQKIADVALTGKKTDRDIAHEIVLEADALRPEIVPWDDDVDAKNIYFSVFAAVVDEAQRVLIDELRNQNRIDLEPDIPLVYGGKESQPGAAGFETVHLKEQTHQSTPVPGAKGKPTKSKQPGAAPATGAAPALTHTFFAAADAISLGRALATAREAAGFTQEEVAKRMGVKQTSVARLENGRTNPTWLTITKFLDAVSVEAGLCIRLPEPPSISKN